MTERYVKTAESATACPAVNHHRKGVDAGRGILRDLPKWVLLKGQVALRQLLRLHLRTKAEIIHICTHCDGIT